MMNKPEMLKKRSELLRELRAFFYARDVIEVDTPILSHAATPDVHLASLQTQVLRPGYAEGQTYYLHTSPEYPMKRLLCEGSGDIFYLGKVFRDGDESPRHQVEFSMLEWYRLGFDMSQLIDEVIALIQKVIPIYTQVEILSYSDAYQKYAQINDVFQATVEDFKSCLKTYQVAEIVGLNDSDIDLWQQLVLTEVIEPQLGQNKISVITHFPAKDAALAKLSSDNPNTAERFEVFINGMELANGYDELADSKIYRARFEESLEQRKSLNLPIVPLDENLLNTLEKQLLPACSGVALGVDRLFMLQQNIHIVNNAVTFATADS